MKVPSLTSGLSILLCLCFGLTILCAIPSPRGLILSIPSLTLLCLGGNVPSLVIHHHEWERLLLSNWLHGNLLHLGMNCLGLWVAGKEIERLLGPLYMATIYLLSGITAAYTSCIWSNYSLSVGASGSIMGLFGALLMIGILIPHGKPLRTLALQVLIPSLIPLFSQVDYWGHLGGTLGGMLTMGVLYALSFHTSARTPLRWGAMILVGSISVMTALSGLRILAYYPSCMALPLS